MVKRSDDPHWKQRLYRDFLEPFLLDVVFRLLGIVLSILLLVGVLWVGSLLR